ncbi:MAG: histidine phosphatase family protein [Pseudomonadota bacterium]|nr:histidine phosphatase family protein [Pseudomonadota bacterium]
MIDNSQVHQYCSFQRNGLFFSFFLYPCRAFRRGVVDTLEAVIAARPRARIVVICHGGVINACAGHVLGVSDPFFLDAGYIGVSRILAASMCEPSVGSLNETAHMRGG